MPANTLEFQVKQAAKAIRRNPLVAAAAITNVAVTLAILGAFFLLVYNLHRMAEVQARSAVITCELSGDRPPEDIEEDLLRDMRISRTEYLPKDIVLKRFAEKSGSDPALWKLLGNPLPAIFVVHLENPDQIEAVRKDVAQISGISRAWYPERVTEKILLVARGVRTAGIVVGLILIVATVTVISTTIRLTIYARSREIRIMQLVGATKWFIRLPFVFEGIFDGFIGGCIAALGVLVGYSYVSAYVAANLEFISLVNDTQFLALFAGGVVLTGIVFGGLGSLTGVRRYLQLV